MKNLFRNILVQLFYLNSFLMLMFIALTVRVFFKRVQNNRRILYRTDRIGDLIIGSDLVLATDWTVYREGTISSKTNIQMPKFLYAPKYAWSKMKEILESGNEIFVPVSSKTPDMLAILLLFERGKRVTVSDTGNNFFAAPIIARVLCDRILHDYGNEYENVRKWSAFENRNIDQLVKSSDRILFAPFGSSLKKSLKENDIDRIIDLLCRNYEIVNLVSNIDPFHHGERFEKKYPNFESYCGKFDSIEELENFVRVADADYLSVDSAPAHIFSKHLKNDQTLTVLSSSAVIHRFDVPNGKTIRKECKFSGCNWICNYGDFRCLDHSDTKFDIVYTKEEKQ